MINNNLEDKRKMAEKMNNCMICHKPIETNTKAILDQTHEAHLQCWCNLLLDADKNTKEEKEKRIRVLIEMFINK